MTREQALELLELEPDAGVSEIRRSYKETYNELQIRLTNAPTEQQKNLYGNRIKKLENAYQLLIGNIEDDFDVLPNISPIAEEDSKSYVGDDKNIEPSGSLSEALGILGLDPDYSEQELYDAYNNKTAQFEDAIQKAPIERAKKLLREGQAELDDAFEVLLKVVIKKGFSTKKKETNTADKKQTSKTTSADKSSKVDEVIEQKKKIKAGLWITIFILIAILGVAGKFGFDYYQEEQYQNQLMTLKAEAEALEEAGDFKNAYLKYEEITQFCKRDCEVFSEKLNAMAEKSLVMHQKYLQEADSLMGGYEFELAKEKFMEAQKWHPTGWDIEESLAMLEHAKEDFEAESEAERQRLQQELILEQQRQQQRLAQEQADRERRARLEASANEMEASGDVYLRNLEYQKAYDFYQKSLDFSYSDRVWKKRTEAENKLPINLFFSFSQVDSRFVNSKDANKEWKTDGGVLKHFSFSEGFSYNKFFNQSRLSEATLVEISVDVMHVSGADNFSFGLLFLGNSTDPSYRFGISANGSTNIGTLEGGKWNTKWESNSAIRKGSGLWNTLKIIYQAGKITYYVNGVQVKQESGRPFGNTIGVFVDARIKESWYDNLSIKATF
ncbi:hypothetical protein [Belliella aquatica]|uniref:Uncharacterized protein n=1 Tax=Belliella aquatica TaxID=1323734 RepID=A0ABQ1N066_9BACT|nr:hypothetical protein [Belliella aquatica]MCH7406799.1 LamG domain-containing protein [Belliella aquatica]GGC48342.1 hypothetical protein GCM10010993_28560 [Belliella aquatica]